MSDIGRRSPDFGDGPWFEIAPSAHGVGIMVIRNTVIPAGTPLEQHLFPHGILTRMEDEANLSPDEIAHGIAVEPGVFIVPPTEPCDLGWLGDHDRRPTILWDFRVCRTALRAAIDLHKGQRGTYHYGYFFEHRQHQQGYYANDPVSDQFQYPPSLLLPRNSRARTDFQAT